MVAGALWLRLAKVERAVLKSLSFLVELFRRDVPMKQISCPTKPFSVFGADIRKQHQAI